MEFFFLPHYTRGGGEEGLGPRLGVYVVGSYWAPERLYDLAAELQHCALGGQTPLEDGDVAACRGQGAGQGGHNVLTGRGENKIQRI